MTVLREMTSGAQVERARRRSWAEMAAGTERALWLRTAVDDLLNHLGGDCFGDLALISGGAAGPRDLGPALFADTTVVPIALFNEGVLELRAAGDLAPALDRLTLHARLDLAGWEALSPVHSVMFVGLWGRTNLTSLTRLGGYGQVAMLTSPAQVISPIDLAECDWRGVGVFAPNTRRAGDGVVETGGWLLEPDRQAPRRVTNMRYEQLVDLAGR